MTSDITTMIVRSSYNNAQAEITIVLASDENVTNKELLYCVEYIENDCSDFLKENGYSLSTINNIGWFKYIPTQSNSIYKRTFHIPFPEGIKSVKLAIKKFYPYGNTSILKAEMKLIN